MSDLATPTMDGLPPEKFLPLLRASFLRRFWVKSGTFILVVSGLILFLLFWEWEATTLKIIEPYFVPPISKIFEKLKINILNGEIPAEMGFSLLNYVIGFAIGTGLAIPLGLLMGTFRIVHKLLSPYVWVMFVMPRIAFLPIVITAMGFGPQAKILFIALGCFFQVIIPTMAGVMTVSPSLVKVGRLFGGSRLQVYRKVVLPYALNFIITGMRLAARTGMMIMYSTEMFGSRRGIATWVILQADLFRMDAAFAGLLALIFLAVTLVSVLDILDNYLRPWKSEVST